MVQDTGQHTLFLLCVQFCFVIFIDAPTTNPTQSLPNQDLIEKLFHEMTQLERAPVMSLATNLASQTDKLKDQDTVELEKKTTHRGTPPLPPPVPDSLIGM